MTSPPITYATVTAILDHPIDAIWLKIAGFGGLEHWADGVQSCVVEGDGVGAIRIIVRNGNSVRERLEAIDPAAHMIRYKILPPNMMPAEDVHGTIALRATAASTTEIVWHSDATAFAVPQAALGARIEQFYAASIDGLRRLLDAA
jgi:Polyketide cyclase / dehydrase and lipid transport